MSVDITFNKKITIKMIRDNIQDCEIEKYEKHNLFVISKCYGICEEDEQYAQIIFQNDINSYEDIENEDIYLFTLRGSGDLIIKEIALKLQAKFLTDNEEFDLHYQDTTDWNENNWNELFNTAMNKVGLTINDNDEIVEIQ